MPNDSMVNQPDWDSGHLRGAIEAAGVALWSWQVDTDLFVMDPQGYRLWDVSTRETLTFEHLSEKVHPADRDRVRAAFTGTRVVKGPYELDFRIIVGPNVRWISARGQGNDVGIVRRMMTDGTILANVTAAETLAPVLSADIHLRQAKLVWRA